MEVLQGVFHLHTGTIITLHGVINLVVFIKIIHLEKELDSRYFGAISMMKMLGNGVTGMMENGTIQDCITEP